jgi:hypothetical protein
MLLPIAWLIANPLIAFSFIGGCIYLMTQEIGDQFGAAFPAILIYLACWSWAARYMKQWRMKHRKPAQPKPAKKKRLPKPQPVPVVAQAFKQKAKRSHPKQPVPPMSASLPETLRHFVEKDIQ